MLILADLHFKVSALSNPILYRVSLVFELDLCESMHPILIVHSIHDLVRMVTHGIPKSIVILKLAL